MNPSSRFTDVLNSILFLLKGLGWGVFLVLLVGFFSAVSEYKPNFF